MIITRTPFRVSFFGGGTDYPVWFQEHPGAVLATTINKYCYISCRPLPPFFEHKSRIVWSQIELVQDRTEIRHPAVREALAFLGIDVGIELHHNGDLPARSGVGSSSAFSVGLLHAFRALRGEMITKTELARDAIHLEQDLLRESVGCQDQVMTAIGGLARIEFFGHNDFRVVPVVTSAERVADLQRHLMLFFTGFARNASDIAREQVQVTRHRIEELKHIYEMVEEGTAILTSERPLDAFGALLHESWILKRSLTHLVSTPEIDAMYEAARAAGATGGKVLGAGGGGFMLLFVRPERQAAVRARLAPLLEVPFAFDRGGSELVYYEPEGRR